MSTPSAAVLLLKAEREKQGLSLRQLAPLVGVDFTTLSNYESGRIEPTVSRMNAWAKALGFVVQTIVRPFAGRPELADADLTVAQHVFLAEALRAAPTLDDDTAQVLTGVMKLRRQAAAEVKKV